MPPTVHWVNPTGCGTRRRAPVRRRRAPVRRSHASGMMYIKGGNWLSSVGNFFKKTVNPALRGAFTLVSKIPVIGVAGDAANGVLDVQDKLLNIGRGRSYRRRTVRHVVGRRVIRRRTLRR